MRHQIPLAALAVLVIQAAGRGHHLPGNTIKRDPAACEPSKAGCEPLGQYVPQRREHIKKRSPRPDGNEDEDDLVYDGPVEEWDPLGEDDINWDEWPKGDLLEEDDDDDDDDERRKMKKRSPNSDEAEDDEDPAEHEEHDGDKVPWGDGDSSDETEDGDLVEWMVERNDDHANRQSREHSAGSMRKRADRIRIAGHTKRDI